MHPHNNNNNCTVATVVYRGQARRPVNILLDSSNALSVTTALLHSLLLFLLHHDFGCTIPLSTSIGLRRILDLLGCTTDYDHHCTFTAHTPAQLLL